MPARIHESVWVNPNKIGNNLGGNHREIKTAAAINPNEAPIPCTKLAIVNIMRLSE